MRRWWARCSLRTRLILLVLLPAAALWLLGVTLAFRTAEREAGELLDAQLVEVGSTLLAIVAGGEVEHVVEELGEHAARYRLPTMFVVWRIRHGDPTLLVRSQDAPALEPDRVLGLHTEEVNGQLWRMYARRDANRGYQVVVGQPYSARLDLAFEVGGHLVAPVLLMLPLIALLIWVSVRRALQPLNRVVDQVRGMQPEDLRDLDVAPGLPGEVRPLVEAMNALTARMRGALEREKEFTADAAHELRTPLAALKVQAQVAQRAADPEARRHALQQVVDGVGRLGHLVGQLLTLARLEPGRGVAADAPVLDLEEIAGNVCAELDPLAQSWQCRLEAALAPARIRGLAPWQAEVLVRNLVDNALRYSAGYVEVRCGVKGTEAWLEVLDNGPGIPVAERERLRQRFVRGAEPRREGAGLGLAIVDRLIELGRGRVDYATGLTGPGPGLSVRVAFPLA